LQSNKNKKMERMKKRNLLLPMLIILAIGFYTCNKKPTEEDFTEPKKIPFTVYSLRETSCRWINVPDGKSEWSQGVVVINSDVELKNYISCTGGSSYPAIDFRKHTLLLAANVEGSGGAVTAINLYQISPTDYVLDIVFSRNLASVETPWQVGIIVNKLNKRNNIKGHFQI